MTDGPARSVEVRHALRGLVSWGLVDGSPLEPIVDPAIADALVDAAAEHRLGGVLAVAGAAGALQLPEPAATRSFERWRDAMTWCLHLEACLVDLHERCASAGVDIVVLKGPAAAHLDEPDPSLRPFADLDLLVRADQLAAVMAVLAEGGATRSWAPRRRGFDERFAKSVTLRRPDGVELDLHRTLADGVFGRRIPTADLWAHLESFALAGSELAALDRPRRALHACYHAVLGSPEPRLMSVRELLAHLTDPGLDPAAVASVAERWRGQPVLAAGLGLVEQVTGVRPEGYETWRAHPIPEAERRRLARQRAEGSGLGRAKLDLVAELPARDRLRYLHALAWPSAEHLRSRGLRRRDLVVRR